MPIILCYACNKIQQYVANNHGTSKVNSMVFSSIPFLLLFLPLTIIGYYLLLRHGLQKYALPFLLLASLFFYAYWKPVFLLLIIFSIFANFYLGQAIHKDSPKRKLIFMAGITMNLLLLGYFKYTDFLISSFNEMFDSQVPIINIILPIGISFYTFQQIAYLSDIYTKKHINHAGGFFEYAAFVCFFPQLIAGPIVHHAEMMPQFASKQNQVLQWDNMYKGLCFLSLGLAKKVLVADQLAPLVNYAFDKSASLSFLESIFACITYTLQLYFDFSGYADMAIGCALFFNIKLPLNFNSPYQALSIQDFWRRWHMTLSRWLRDYLYIPLGGNRGSSTRTMGNLFLTFLLGGIWHGAGITFILWGALHGMALVLHRIWSQILHAKMPKLLAWILTFAFISLAWIPFRSLNLERLGLFIDGLLGQNGFFVRAEFSKVCYDAWRNTYAIDGGMAEYSIALFILLFACLKLKNSQQLIEYITLRPFRIYIMALLSLALTLLILPGYVPEFIYFQF